MATIDDKVVAMSFENSKFESGVKQSISSIDKLKAALKFDGATKGLENIDRATQGVQTGLLSKIGNALDSIIPKFDALRLVAIGVMSQIATKAITAGASLVKSLTLDPIIQGFHEYTTNLNAVQTIMANTQAAGTTLKDVNKALNQLNHYSDKTIYNFSEMARNIGTFTAAGVDLKTSTEAIKGIANLAALSGSNADQASTAMYQLSQAIAAGQVHLQDWNSVVNAGMGGTVFQRALAQTAVAMGTIDGKTVKLTGKMKNVSIAGNSFRQSLTPKPGEKSWLTSKVLTTTLSEFTGDLTDAQLKAKGFNEEQIKAIQQTAKTAMHAATQVKTLGQLLDTTKEAIGSGWAQTWQLVFGDFNQAKTLFTGVSNAINGFISTSSKARNNVLKDWAALGGRTALIKSIGNIFKTLGAILAPIKDAFHDIFPPVTGKNLADLTKRFEEFTKSLKPSKEVIDGLHRTFRGFFAILDIGKQILGGIFDVFKRVFSAIAAGTGSFLGITGSIGDFFVKVDEALKKGKGLSNFFNGLGDILVAPVKMIEKLKDALAHVFDGFSSGGPAGKASGILGQIGTAFGNLLEAFSHSDKIINHVIDAFSQFAQAIGPSIVKAFQNINFEAILAVIRTGLLGGLVIMFKQFLGSGSLLQQLGLGGLGGGIIDKFTAPFSTLTGTLKDMQTQIKAKTLEEIAIAVALLAASVLVLSLVNPKKLSASLGAMTVAFGELLAGMAILTAVTKTAGFIKLPVIASSLILLAGAIVILTLAVAILAQLDWNQLTKGLTGVGVLLGIISVAVIPLSANSAGMIRAGVGITAIAVALLILSEAVKRFAKMSWGELAQGLIGVGVGLAVLIAAMRFMPTGGMVAAGVGLIALSVGLEILAGVVTKFGNMDWAVMGKGMLGIGAALVVIAGAMRLMPGNLLVTAAGLLIVSLALEQISKVIKGFGGMSINEIAKGLGTLAGALIILGVALYAMSGTLAGSAALVVAAYGVSVLAGALKTLGSMSWQQIVTSLVALAAAFVILGVAGSLITPAIPGLLGLGAAMLLIGAGLALAGVGISLIAAGLSALIVALPTGIGIIIAALSELLKGLIDNAKLLILGVLEIADQLAKTAPRFVDAFIKILNSVIDGLSKLTPKFEELMQILIDAMLKLLDDNEDNIINAGINFVLAFLKGINDNVSKLVDVGIQIVTTFLSSIASHAGEIAAAGLNIIVKIVEGIANNVKKLVAAGADIIVNIIKGVSNSYNKVIQAGADAISKFITGVENAAEKIIRAGVAAATKFMNAMSNQIPRMANNAATAFIHLLNNMSDVIEKRQPEVMVAMAGVGAAIIKGTVKGIEGGQQEILNAIMDLIPGPIKSVAKKVLGIASPSKLTMGYGKAIADGFIIGMRQGMAESEQTAADLGTQAMNSMQRSIQNISGMVSAEMDKNNLILTPILDLTQVRSQAQELSKLTTVSPITAAVSLKQASNISPITPDAQTVAALGGSAVHFEQNNYSPKALTEVEIYRQTRNQLSQLKTSLAIN
jgi:tape measure domain-containing protein